MYQILSRKNFAQIIATKIYQKKFSKNYPRKRGIKLFL